MAEKGAKKLFKPLIDLAQKFSYEEPQTLVSQHLEDNLFGFYSPSGGTGVTTVVANVAALLANQNLNIAVVDFDMYYPSLFRYLQEDDQVIKNSLLDIFITPGANIPEFAAPTKYPTLSLYSNTLDEDVYQLAELDVLNVIQFLRDISALYDFVLVDIKGVLNQETTIAAISECYRIFTFVRPLVSDSERIYKDNLILQNYMYGPKVKNVVQTMIRDDEFSAEEFKTYGFNLLENIPFALAVEKVGANNELFVMGNYGSDKPSQLFRAAIKHIAELIVNSETGGK